MLKKCSICGQDFKAVGKSKYCNECKENLKVSCYNCNKDFILSSRYNLSAYQNKDKSLFCSNECSLEYKSKFTKELSNEITKKICKSCGVHYEGTTYSKYCPDCSKETCRICGKKYDKEKGYKRYCSEECYKKSVEDSYKKGIDTKLERYGFVGFDNELTRKKAQESILQKFGTDNVFKLKAIQEAIKKKNLEKYGAENVFSSPDIQERIKATLVDRYGVDNPSKSSICQLNRKIRLIDKSGDNYLDNLEFTGEKLISDSVLLDKIFNLKIKLNRNPTPAELWEETDYKSLASIYQRISQWRKLESIEINELFLFSESSLELAIEDFLKSVGLDYIKHSRKIIPPLEVDFYIPEHKLAIEVNDFITHNSTYSPYDQPKDKFYHFNKTLACREKGIRLIHAWEDYIIDERKFNILKNAIKNACKLNERKVYARDTYVEVTPAIRLKDFFNENNISGYRGAKLAYTLKHKKTGEVLMSYLVGDSLFGRGSEKKYDAEIIRGASLLGTTVVGGASKLWSYIIENTYFNSIVYYVDLNLYNGNSLSFLKGTELVKEQPSFKNYFVEEGVLKNRSPAKHSELSKLTKEGSVWQVWDAGTQVWVWRRETVDKLQVL